MSSADRSAIFILSILKALVIHSNLFTGDELDECSSALENALDKYKENFVRTKMSGNMLKRFQEGFEKAFSEISSYKITKDFVISLMIYFSEYHKELITSSELKYYIWDSVEDVATKYIGVDVRSLDDGEKWMMSVVNVINKGF